MRMHIASAVPDEVLQAARVDGASTFRTFWSVVLPMIRPAAAILGLFGFLFAWNDFFWPLIVLQTQDSWTAQVALRQVQNTAYVTDYGVQFAATVIATLPLLIVGLVLGRQLVRGIMEGAVKG
jgi:cellobiose transport system permease protein